MKKDDNNNKNELETYGFLSSVLSSLEIGIAILIPPDYRYLKINKFLAQINGLTVEEHEGRTLKEVLPDAEPVIAPRLNKVLSSGVTSSKVVFKAKLPGSSDTRWFEDVFIPIKGKDGSVIALVANVFEITNLKKAQEQTKERTQSLEQFNKMATDRELRMIELKEKIKALELQLAK